MLAASAIPAIRYCPLEGSPLDGGPQDMSDGSADGSVDGSASDSSGPNSPATMTTCESNCNGGEPSSDWYASIPNRGRHEALLRSALDIILNDAVFSGTDRANRVLEYVAPHEMPFRMDITLPVNGPSNDEEILQAVKDTIRYAVKTGHPRFVNQLFGGLDPYGLLGQWVTDALNPSMYTYEVAPLFTLMEEAVLQEMRNLVGFAVDQGDGLFCPGGSIANMYAFSCARFDRFPEAKNKGLSNLPRLVAFTSEDSHYSVQKSAALLGIGADNVYKVKTDARGCLDPEHLVELVVKARQEGAEPFLVSATSGTTVLGAFDPLDKISEVCNKYNIWMHVDAAWGGGALLSRKHRHLLRGISKAHSVTWNPHKLMAAPQQCSVFLTRKPGLLTMAHSASAGYLFQPDKFYDTSFDSGDKHIQCGRRADVFKLWLMWKAKGTEGLEKHIDHVFDVSQYFTEAIRCRPGWELVLREPQCTNVCFWYIPPSLRKLPQDQEYNQRLHKVAPKLKEMMMKSGSMMVTYQPLKGLPNFFRLVIPSSGTTREDINFLICEFERLGSQL